MATAKDCTYPVSLDSAPTDRAQGDVVPSSDLNKYFDAAVFLENTVGITGSAVTTSLNYKLTNAASIEPGHMHGVLYDSVGSTICISAGNTTPTQQWGGVKYIWPTTDAMRPATGSALQVANISTGALAFYAHIKVRLSCGVTHGVGTEDTHVHLMDTVDFDTAGVGDITTNKGRITPGVAGFYMVGGLSCGTNVDAGSKWRALIYVSGTETLRGTAGNSGASSNQYSSISGIVKLSATDYVELYCYNGSSGTINWMAGSSYNYLYLFGPL